MDSGHEFDRHCDTADLRRMADARAGAFLVGESLLRQPDLVGATRKLLGIG